MSVRGDSNSRMQFLQRDRDDANDGNIMMRTMVRSEVLLGCCFLFEFPVVYHVSEPERHASIFD